MDLNSVLMLLILLVISTVGVFLKDTPNLLRELKVEKLRGKNDQNLQIESYFREISGTDIQDVLKNWTTLMDKLRDSAMTDKELKNHMSDLTTRTLMYGSNRTINIFSFI